MNEIFQFEAISPSPVETESRYYTIYVLPGGIRIYQICRK